MVSLVSEKSYEVDQKPKINSFIEVYLIPYTQQHHYWTGLLLLIRVSLYLVTAFNPSGNPRVTLTATTFIMTSLLLYIATFSVKMYKNHFINIMEMLTYFNIIALSIFTRYTIDADTNQIAITNISVGITFIQLTTVIFYHVCKHMNLKLFIMIQGSDICMNIKQLTSKIQKRHKNTDAHKFHEMLDYINCPPANTNNHNVFLMQPNLLSPLDPSLNYQNLS